MTEGRDDPTGWSGETNSRCSTVCTLRHMYTITALSRHGLVHGDENAEHSSDECRKGHRLDKYTQASGGEEPLGQCALDSKVSQCACERTGKDSHPRHQLTTMQGSRNRRGEGRPAHPYQAWRSRALSGWLPTVVRTERHCCSQHLCSRRRGIAVRVLNM